MSKAKKKGDKKGKTMALTDFLAAENAPKLVTVKPNNWSDIVDQELDIKPVVFDVSNLPTAPRGAIDIDYSDVPKNPPFVAHVANLSFEITDDDLRRTFADLNPKSARVIKEGTRSRGVGFVEFETRENLIEALKRTDKDVSGRKIRVVVSDKTDSHHTDGGGRGFSNRSGPNRGGGGGGGEERAEMSETWRRAAPEPRSDDRFDNRGSGGFDRDRSNRGDYGRLNTSGGPHDGQRGNDYGYGYPRTRDDRGGGGGRDYDRQGPRNRRDDDARSNSGMDRPRYGGRYSDNRDLRDRNTAADDNSQDDRREAPKERPRLQLQPRTKPLVENDALSASSSSVNNVAADVTHTPSTSISNTNGADDSSVHQDQTDGRHENLHDDPFRPDASDSSSPVEQSTTKPQVSSRGAGASIFGGAKPVDTATRELEIERKLKELEVSNTTTGDNNEESVSSSSSRPSYNRGSGERDRDNYRGNRSLQSDDYHNRDRDRRDDGRYNRTGDYHHKREYSGGRQYEDDSRRRNDDDQNRRGGGGSGSGYDRDRYSGPARRDNDSGRTGKYNHHNQPERDNDRPPYRESNRNYQPRDRDDREAPPRQQRISGGSGHDSNEFNEPLRQPASSSDNTFNADSSSRNQQRGANRRIVAPTDDDTNRLQLSNKFGMLDVEDLDNDEVQSPTTHD